MSREKRGKIIVYKQRKICYHMKASVGGKVLRTRKNGHDSGPFPFHPNIFAGAFLFLAGRYGATVKTGGCLLCDVIFYETCNL